MRARRVELDRGTLRIRERRGNERDIGCRSLSNARDYITSRPLEGGTGDSRAGGLRRPAGRVSHQNPCRGVTPSGWASSALDRE